MMPHHSSMSAEPIYISPWVRMVAQSTLCAQQTKSLIKHSTMLDCSEQWNQMLLRDFCSARFFVVCIQWWEDLFLRMSPFYMQAEMGNQLFRRKSMENHHTEQNAPTKLLGVVSYRQLCSYSSNLLVRSVFHRQRLLYLKKAT